MHTHSHALPGPAEFKHLFYRLLGPELRFYKLVLIYSLAISLLTLAIPISIQSLIDTIANIGLARAVVVISLFLFALLVFSGVLYALRAYVMELFNRRIFIRLASEMAVSAVAARESGIDERKRLALFNRFFDIMTLKKNVPYILTNGFSLVLQSIIGFIVVSLYHLYFFLFAVALVLLIWIVWKLWGWKAINSAFRLSEAKYETADWLQSLSISLRDFKATGNVDYILREFNEVVNHHVDRQEEHFAFNYRQLLSLLFINAVASAVLLGMGGWLVIQGELTLGQLVAAELIMLGIFAGLPLLAGYLDYFYDICAAVEEISRFQALPQEKIRVAEAGLSGKNLSLGLSFRKAGFGEPGPNAVLIDFQVKSGEIVRVEADDQRIMNLVKNTITGNIFPARGDIYVGKLSINEINAFELRKLVKVVDRASVIPGSIRHYLLFACPGATQKAMRDALDTAGMSAQVDRLHDGLDTVVSADGWPLGLEHTLRLKLATVVLSQPAILVLDQIADLVDARVMENVLAACRTNGTTVLYRTHRNELAGFGRTLELACEHGSTPE